MSIQSVKKVLLGALLGACSVAAAPAAWSAPSNVLLNPFNANTFVVLPSDVKAPEGIAFIPSNRSLIIGTLTLGTGPNFLLRYSTSGKLQARLPVASPLGSISMTLNPRDNKVYFVNPLSLAGADALIQRVPVDFNASTPIETVAVIPNIPAPAPRNEAAADMQPIVSTFGDSVSLANGVAFRASDGALFIADSTQAAIFQIPDPSNAANNCPTSSACVSILKQDPLLASATNPQLGANSVLISPDETLAYITNTGDDRVLTLNLQTGALATFAENIQGADGLALGPDNTLLVSAFLGNEVVVLDLNGGRTLAKFGGFRGIDKRGVIKGLLAAGSLAVAGNVVFAANLAMANGPNSPAADVMLSSVTKIFLPRRFAR